ncbi:chorismate mutase [Amycolatopsis jiangsuensis]|uniref:chorismate mutase n=1 Tax=Amycolatopsis jiangsuensis TaxID=1181879 RepID=A0A840IPS3_9PSEU|nr:chorismate mutase [Amycolatopsis jiangsuensis]MBB4684386.1 chorismate mutase [Amycolatopsis jiangsuensis]
MQLKTSTKVARGIAATALTVAGTMTLSVPAATAAEIPTGAALTANGSLGRLGSLTDLVVERLRVGDDVAAAKFGTDSPIDDPAREEQVLNQVREQAGAIGLDPDAAAAFFRDQITASKVVQRGLFDRWTTHPDQAPTTRPDLGQIRARLDQLTAELLAHLKTTMDVRADRIPCTVQLALATGSAIVLDRLDALHRQALGTAVHSVCAVSPA